MPVAATNSRANDASNNAVLQKPVNLPNGSDSHSQPPANANIDNAQSPQPLSMPNQPQIPGSGAPAQQQFHHSNQAHQGQAPYGQQYPVFAGGFPMPNRGMQFPIPRYGTAGTEFHGQPGYAAYQMPLGFPSYMSIPPGYGIVPGAQQQHSHLPGQQSAAPYGAFPAPMVRKSSAVSESNRTGTASNTSSPAVGNVAGIPFPAGNPRIATSPSVGSPPTSTPPAKLPDFVKASERRSAAIRISNAAGEAITLPQKPVKKPAASPAPSTAKTEVATPASSSPAPSRPVSVVLDKVPSEEPKKASLETSVPTTKASEEEQERKRAQFTAMFAEFRQKEVKKTTSDEGEKEEQETKVETKVIEEAAIVDESSNSSISATKVSQSDPKAEIPEQKPKIVPEPSEVNKEQTQNEAQKKETPKESETVEERSQAIDKDKSGNVDTTSAPAEVEDEAAEKEEKDAINKKSAEALEQAIFITDLSAVKYAYPNKPPLATLNRNMKSGKFLYDLEFLMQFSFFDTKPTEEFARRVKDIIDDDEPKGGKYLSSAGARGRPAMGGAKMGQFGQDMPIRSRYAGGASGGAGGQNWNFNSQGQMKGPMPPRAPSSQNNQMSKDGRQSSRKPGLSGSKKGMDNKDIKSAEPVAPLEVSANRWMPRSRIEAMNGPSLGQSDTLAPEVVQRKVKSLLNKLTLEKFDKISDQILEISSQSKKETDGRTLRQIIQLTFEKATDEPNFSEIYARLCRKLMENIDPAVRDNSILDKEGKPVVGGAMFRKYLLNRCEEEFMKGWKFEKPKVEGEGEAEEEAKNGHDGEAELYSDEYYAASAAKRRGLGLVRLIGELFKLQMLTENIMHNCVKQLIGDIHNPQEEEIESLCKLLQTVGYNLDNGKHASLMNIYFQRMTELSKNDKLPSRIRFMVMDVIDLRQNKWVDKDASKGPKTIQELHAEAAMEKAQADSQRQSSHSSRRPQMGQGDARLNRTGSSNTMNSFGRLSTDELKNMKVIRSSSGAPLGPQGSSLYMRKSTHGASISREHSNSSSRGASPGTQSPLPGRSASKNSFEALSAENDESTSENNKTKNLDH